MGNYSAGNMLGARTDYQRTHAIQPKIIRKEGLIIIMLLNKSDDQDESAFTLNQH